jgi:hypothetical protein
MFIINPYVFNASEDLLLDLYSDSILGISISRKLRTAYTGDHLFLRRADGSTTATQYVDNEFDEAGITTFADGQDVFIRTVYDNSQSFDATQAIEANQPKIVSSGVVIKSNGKPAMSFNGINNFLSCGTINGGTKPANYSVLNVYETHIVGGGKYIYGSFNSSASGSTPWVHIGKNNTEIRHDFSDGVNNSSHTASTPIVANTQGLFQVSYTNGNTAPVIRHDGSELTLTPVFEDATSCAGTEYGFSIGRPGEWNNKYYEGLQSEIIAFNVDNLANTAAIENNINTHYNTY